MNRMVNRARAALRYGLLGLMTSLPLAAMANDPFTLGLNDGNSVREFTLAIGKTQIIRSDVELRQIAVGNPQVADVELLNEHQFLILGREPGTTNVAFHGENDQVIAILDIVVGYDLEAIKRKLHEIVPSETVEVRSANGNVVLSGEVASASVLETIMSLVQSYAPNDAILNLVQVGGGQQVMLEARIAEVQRNKLRNLGVQSQLDNFSLGSNTDISLITGVASGQNTFGGAMLQNNVIGDSLVLGLEALEREGSAQILAEPNIVALSGQEASFLVGGEFPVPIVQGGAANAITIQYREFGVGLRFTPTVLSSDRINLQLNTEVSDIDTTSGTTVLGTTVPGLRTRRAATTIELGDGTSFAIAGLLQNDIGNVVRQFPGLGNLPILGALFRSSTFEQDETELVIVITPRLVRSADRNEIRLPTEGYTPPTRREQYLEGRIEGRSEEERTREGDSTGPNNNTQGLDGQSGHQF